MCVCVCMYVIPWNNNNNSRASLLAASMCAIPWPSSSPDIGQLQRFLAHVPNSILTRSQQPWKLRWVHKWSPNNTSNANTTSSFTIHIHPTRRDFTAKTAIKYLNIPLNLSVAWKVQNNTKKQLYLRQYTKSDWGNARV